MGKQTKPEKQILPPEEDWLFPPEDTLPPEDEGVLPPEEGLVLPWEEQLPPEQPDLPKNEYAGEGGPKAAPPVPLRQRLKRMILMPVAGTVAAVSLVLAAMDLDPLGDDILGKNLLVAAESAAEDPGNNPSDPKNPSNPSNPSGPSDSPTEPGSEGAGQLVEVRTVGIYIHFEPTDETYFTENDDEDAAMAEAVAWLREQGGDTDYMSLVETETVVAGIKVSDDAVIEGDLDDLDHARIVQGTVTRTTRVEYHYAATYSPSQIGDADTKFPVLPNMDPDFEGAWAWNGMGYSEEYVMMDLNADDSSVLLWAGTYYTEYLGISLTTVPGATYDKETNVLTLENFTGYHIDVNCMGNGFTIRLVGDNYLGSITVWGAYYGGSVTFTGDGSLTIKDETEYPADAGIYLNCENSPSCVMVDRNVTLDVYAAEGTLGAIVVSCTTLDKGIYYLAPLQMTGGERASGMFLDYSKPIFNENGLYIGSESITMDEFVDDDGNQLYDAAILDENGEISLHVRFAPRGK